MLRRQETFTTAAFRTINSMRVDAARGLREAL
jgi:hypothetical protein